ncbi:hypothetical protein ACTFIT_009180 [Dictyostelium discoideum]
MDNNEDIFFKVFRNKYIRYIIFNEIKLFNHL